MIYYKDMADKNVSWFQVNNWVPIIVSIVMMTISFGALLTRIALVEQRLVDLIDLNKTSISEYKVIQAKISEHETRISLIENRLKK